MFEILIILWKSNNCLYLTSSLPDNFVAKLPVVKFSFSDRKKNASSICGLILSVLENVSHGIKIFLNFKIIFNIYWETEWGKIR